MQFVSKIRNFFSGKNTFILISIIAMLFFTNCASEKEGGLENQTTPGNEMARNDLQRSSSTGSVSGKTGCVEGDCENGYGVYIYDNHDKYSGYFKGGVRNGKGNFEYANGDRFEGSYENDMKEGEGLYKFKNGDIFRGSFKGGKPSGNAEYKFVNGIVYQGEFLDARNSKSGYISGNSKKQRCEIKDRKIYCE